MMLQLQRSAGNAGALALLREVVPPSAGATDPGGEPFLGEGGGKMPAAAFLDGLYAELTTAVERELGADVFRLRGCPWLDHWIGFYRTQPPAKVEHAVRRYAPAARAATSAQDAIAAVVERVRAGIATWKENGQLPDLPADSPGVPPGEPAFKLRPDAEPPGAEAGALAGRLGRGEPLDATTREQVGASHGADLSRVRIHRDPVAAQAVSDLGARAATIGHDVAFAPGEYEPGTMVGDALIAHELAHVVQQGSAGSAGGATLERDADEAAIAAVAPRWAPGFERPNGRPLLPAGRGLRLQRCPTSKTTWEKDSEKLAADAGIRITMEPADVEKLPVGVRARFRLTEGRGNTEKSRGVRQWGVKGPGADMDRASLKRDPTIVFDRPGEWMVAAEFSLDGKKLIISRTFTVVSNDELMNEAMDKTAPADYITHRGRLVEERLKRAKGGVLDQNYGGAYITNDGPDAANPAPIADFKPFTFAIHPGPPEPGKPVPVKYRWWAIPRNHADKLSYRKDIGKWDVYEGENAVFRGQAPKATFIREWPVEVEMVCEMVSADDQLVGKAYYEQVIQNKDDLAGVKQVDTFLKDAGKHYREIKPGQAEGLRAIHLDLRTGQISQLSLFVGPSADGKGYTLVDLTPGAETAVYEGSTVRAAIDEFADGNSHGKGRIDVEYAGPPPLHLTMKTRGESGIEERAKKVGLGGLIIAGIGALAAFTPAAPLAPYIVGVGLGVGAGASAGSIIGELRKAKPSGTKIAIDMTTIVSSLAGAGLTMKAVQIGTVELAAASTFGRMAVYTGFGSDAIGGVLIGVQTADQIEQIRHSKLSEDDKIDAISRLIAQVAITGTFIVFGSKDLGATRSRVEHILGDEVAAWRLKPDVLYGLHSLDDAALASLKGLGRTEVDAIAKALARDPRGAERLAKAYGKQFIDEVRMNPARGFDELDDILAARAAKHARAGQAGGVHGWNHPTKAGEGVATLSPDRLKTALKSVGGSSRLHPTKWVKIEATKRGSATVTLEVTPNGFDHPVTLVVTIEMQPGGSLKSGPQTGSGRIAQIEDPKSKGGPWTMRYEMDGDLLPEALPHVLGRGLDEAAGWMATRGGSRPSFSAQGGPSLFTPWATRGTGRAGPPPITVGDRAAARELLGVMADIRKTESEITKTAASIRNLEKDAVNNAEKLTSSREALEVLQGKLKNRQETYRDMRLDMGLYDPQYIELKLKLLRDTAAGMTNEARYLEFAGDKSGTALDRLIADAQAVASETAHRVLASRGKTVLTAEDVTHLMHPLPRERNFKEWGIAGGHYDPHLQAFVAANPEYALVRIESARSGSSTFVHYEQYKWRGQGPPPRKGDPRYPTKDGPVSADWEPCEYPKTTFSDPDTFLAYANGEIQTWKGQQKPPLPRRTYEIGGDPPLIIFAEIDKDGVLDITTVYIKASWIDKTGAAQKTPTPVPTR